MASRASRIRVDVLRIYGTDVCSTRMVLQCILLCERGATFIVCVYCCCSQPPLPSESFLIGAKHAFESHVICSIVQLFFLVRAATRSRFCNVVVLSLYPLLTLFRVCRTFKLTLFGFSPTVGPGSRHLSSRGNCLRRIQNSQSNLVVS